MTKRRSKKKRAKSSVAAKAKTRRLSAIRLDPQKWERAKKDAIKKMDGVFSARAMQYAVALYKKRGGRYKGGKTGKESLALWTAEKWQTRPGTPKIAKRGRTTARYLPQKAWEMLTEEEAVATDMRKRRACRGEKGPCFIPNTPKAKKARKSVSEKVQRSRLSRA
jgi:hypothetical protein